jgi:hypothetical protein
MKYGKLMLLVATFLAPAAAWAGRDIRALSPAPALGEAGLIALGIGLVGAGLAFLRKR